MKTRLDEAIDEAAKKLSPMNPVTYSGDYKYWSGLLDARNMMVGKKPTDESTVTGSPS